MNKKKQAHWILFEIAEEQSPGNTINLWPQVEPHLVLESKAHQKRVMSGNVKRRFSINKPFLYGTLMMVFILIAATVFIPTVQAQVNEWVSGQTSLFSFLIPHSKVTTGLFSDGSWGFVPLSPTYLPKGDWLTVPDSSKDEATGLDSLRLTMNKDNQFVILTERKALAGETLPFGKVAKVNDLPAVLVTGLSGEVSAGIPLAKDGGVQPKPSGLVVLNSIQYTDGLRLTWQMGEIRLEIFSNLPLNQVMKIATSLHVVEVEPAEMINTEN